MSMIGTRISANLRKAIEEWKREMAKGRIQISDSYVVREALKYFLSEHSSSPEVKSKIELAILVEEGKLERERERLLDWAVTHRNHNVELMKRKAQKVSPKLRDIFDKRIERYRGIGKRLVELETGKKLKKGWKDDIIEILRRNGICKGCPYEFKEECKHIVCKPLKDYLKKRRGVNRNERRKGLPSKETKRA